MREGLNAIEGKAVPKNTATPLIAITPQNMNSASVKPYVYVSACH